MLRPGGNRTADCGMCKETSDRKSPGAECPAGRGDTALFAAAGKIKCGGAHAEQPGKTGHHCDRKGKLLSESGQEDTGAGSGQRVKRGTAFYYRRYYGRVPGGQARNKPDTRNYRERQNGSLSGDNRADDRNGKTGDHVNP